MSRPSLEFLFVIDPLEALILETETSLLIMRESQARGHTALVAYLNDLYLRDRVARVHARSIEIDESAHPFYKLGPLQDRSLADFDLVLMRKDPPVDNLYYDALTVLEVACDQVPVLNNPVGLRCSNEKLLPLEIPGAAAPSVMAADATVVAEFVREYPDVVVKPLNEFSGHGITRLSVNEFGLDPSAIGELATQNGQHVLVQRFLPEVTQGDKRVFVLEGEPLGWVNRLPRPGSFRANIHQGASIEPCELSEREREIIDAAAPILASRGLAFAGFDFIGEYLTEVNVTSPSAMRQINEVMETKLQKPLVDYLERRARNV